MFSEELKPLGFDSNKLNVLVPKQVLRKFLLVLTRKDTNNVSDLKYDWNTRRLKSSFPSYNTVDYWNICNIKIMFIQKQKPLDLQFWIVAINFSKIIIGSSNDTDDNKVSQQDLSMLDHICPCWITIFRSLKSSLGLKWSVSASVTQ